MRNMLIAAATAAPVSALTSGVALADSVTTDFESFALGTVDGQGGWKSAVPGDIPSLPNGYDQGVVQNSGGPAGFGGRSFRLSNAYNPDPGTAPPEFHFQTYSTPTLQPAGEHLSNSVYSAQFSFISAHPDSEQSGLRVSVSPDMGEGGRMSYIGLNDTADGIDVVFYDTPAEDGGFEAYDLGTLPRDTAHTIRFWMKLNPGPDNDLVRIFIDGRDVGQCFTTWENFYRSASQDVPISDRLLFLSGSRDGNHPNLLGGGYLFDNVTTTTADGPGPPGCDLPIVKEATSATVHAGGLARYKITVRNRGRALARNLRVCDRIPRHTTFVSADRRLIRLGRARCLIIRSLAPGKRVSFHVELRVAANAPPGRMDNIADITPGDTPGTDSPRLLPVIAALPPEARQRIKAAVRSRVVARVRVLQATRTRPPPVTG